MKKSPYTTIQISKEINSHIKKYCKLHGVHSSFITERLWSNYISASRDLDKVVDLTTEAKLSIISSSMSGSISLQG
jgi:hypothetical protein